MTTFTFFRGTSIRISVTALTVFLFFLFSFENASAQCPPGVACDFLTQKSSLSSTRGAEISAFDSASKRVFTVAGSVIEYHQMSNTGTLTFLDILPVGFTVPTGRSAVPNSVAASKGIIAVSYAITSPDLVNGGTFQHNGRVTFYNAGTAAVLGWVEVGALPDMIVFTADGKKLLTANEGEPSSYNKTTSLDPEGTVSIVDLSAGIAAASVHTVGFSAFNGQIAALRAQGIRIYGPNATVAQDIEPEYIALSPDGSKAWITLQENNAIAILDMASETITNIYPLGLKDHNKPTVTGLDAYTFPTMPSIGITTGGQDMRLGGFSGLGFEGIASNGNLRFITHTDRGPNGEPTGQTRPFALPAFAPEIVRFELNRSNGQIMITQRIQLKKSNGQLLTGLPNINRPGGTESTANHDERGIDLFGNPTGVDIMGADLEGIVKGPDGSFWMVDEYRPALYHFDPNGLLLKRYVPAGTADSVGLPVGTYGQESLPAVLGKRRQNRGFEGIAMQDNKLYLFVQSPIRNPSSSTNGTLNAWKYTRVVEFNPLTETTTAQYIYVMDNATPLANGTDTRADKIGDAASLNNGEFLLIERDDDAIDSDPQTEIQKKIYRFSLIGATNVNSLPELIGGKTIEQMTPAELSTNGILPITKYLHADLASNYNSTEKVEGLAVVDCNTLALINDNDFGVGGLSYNTTTGTFNNYPNPTAEAPLLGLLKLHNTALDANDRDVNGTSAGGGKISIRNWPVFGMYQPDAIASFNVNGQDYYITANEGDARDYTGYSEELRVGSYALDPVQFPNATALKNNLNLGRLTGSIATGNTDADPEFEQIHVLGARSFSIWNSSGQQVFDSGDELERITAALSPLSFNSDGTSASFDTRSDNKGPEIEAVVIGMIGGSPYAFVGSERTGDIFVYDVSNPAKPIFKQYINTPEDLGVEGLAFVPANNSPTGRPLLLSSSEVSKTVTVYEINAPVCAITAIPSNNIYTGGIPTNLYLGYGPQSVRLQTSEQPATGGPYTYSWSGNGVLSNYNTPNPVFTASDAGTYTFTVTISSQCGIKTSCSISICVTDIRVPGSNGRKVYICHKDECSDHTRGRDCDGEDENYHHGNTLAISVEAVAAHLRNHAQDRLGRCGQVPCSEPTEMYTQASRKVTELEESVSVDVNAYPNPSNTSFNLNVRTVKNEMVSIRVMDAQGRILFTAKGNQGIYNFGSQFAKGLYLAEISIGDRKQIIKLNKL